MRETTANQPPKITPQEEIRALKRGLEVTNRLTSRLEDQLVEKIAENAALQIQLRQARSILADSHQHRASTPTLVKINA